MYNKSYDIIIVGAGPTGLALAQCLSNIKNKKILVIDREKTIGGCHRVIRDKDGLFTEHGPRVYSSHYVNLFHLMNEFGLNVYDVFTDYKYSSIGIIFDILPNITITEVLKLTIDYLYFMFDENYGSDINYEKYLKDNNFSEKIIDIFDRIYRFLDGGKLSSYSLNKVLKLIDSVIIITVLQPKKPLDEGLFKYWKPFLEKRGVDFLLETNIEKINYKDGKIVSINANNKNILLDKLILALPPASISKILENNDTNVKNSFGNLESFKEWSEKTEYIDYISITYHFINDIDIPNVYGATLNTDWGLICINLSDYMKDVENKYKKIISVAITYTDRKSKFINKTANECSASELYDEVYRQLKVSIYPNLPNKEYYKAIINPNNYYKNGKWNCKDEAYFKTIGTKNLKYNSDTISNIYNSGTHNGFDNMNYTIMESAIINGITVAKKLYPELKDKYELKTFLTMKDYLFYLFIIIIVYLIYIIISSSSK